MVEACRGSFRGQSSRAFGDMARQLMTLSDHAAYAASYHQRCCIG